MRGILRPGGVTCGLVGVVLVFMIFIGKRQFSTEPPLITQPVSAWIDKFNPQQGFSLRNITGELNGAGVHQEDLLLKKYLQHEVIKRPPTSGKLNLDKPNKMHFSQRGQDEIIDKLLKQRRNGFFIEVGGANGELHSNSLFFERERNWSGILIEADPSQYKQLLSKNRRIYSAGACLSMTRFTQKLQLQIQQQGTTFVDADRHKNINRTHVKTVQCYPLWAILRAMDRTHVDLFSLDVEGAEEDVLKTIPFDKVRFDILTIEWLRWGDSQNVTLAHREGIAKVIEATGLYRKVAEAKDLDDIYMHVRLLT